MLKYGIHVYLEATDSNSSRYSCYIAGKQLLLSGFPTGHPHHFLQTIAFRDTFALLCSCHTVSPPEVHCDLPSVHSEFVCKPHRSTLNATVYTLYTLFESHWKQYKFFWLCLARLFICFLFRLYLFQKPFSCMPTLVSNMVYCVSWRVHLKNVLIFLYLLSFSSWCYSLSVSFIYLFT